MSEKSVSMHLENPYRSPSIESVEGDKTARDERGHSYVSIVIVVVTVGLQFAWGVLLSSDLQQNLFGWLYLASALFCAVVTLLCWPNDRAIGSTLIGAGALTVISVASGPIWRKEAFVLGVGGYGLVAIFIILLSLPAIIGIASGLIIFVIRRGKPTSLNE